MKPAEPRQSRWKGVAGVGALCLLLAASAWVQEAPESTQEVGHGVFQGCLSGQLCYWSTLPPVRLAGIDAPDPEVDRMYAIDARNALEREIKYASEVEVRAICRDPMGRVVAHLKADGRDLSTWMIRNGYARPADRSLCR